MKRLFFILTAMIFFASCNNDAVPLVTTAAVAVCDDENISLNKEIVRKENANIALIAKRYRWNLEQTPTGLFYEILNKKTGNYPQTKDEVQIKGKIYLQDGTELYNDKTDGIKAFIVNRSEDPVGLHELVKLMCEGEKSRAIIPSYLAYGITGSEETPPLAFWICEIELIKIN
ncbi:MAG: FKBP-type peptidyl-prolyl cis-trans isomerase [Lentimicrobiaceae bacterium]|nr:FKBP-type peptidyl-prolyl cis-trans isomerase [Lentimicrobiaceae bacterium]